jgi:hypothetical protein
MYVLVWTPCVDLGCTLHAYVDNAVDRNGPDN